MYLRDILLFSVLVWLIFTIPRKPFIGALAWVVFGVMNPHRLTYGPAFNFPFSLVIAVLTLLGLLLNTERLRPKGGAAAVTLCLLLAWITLTLPFAINASESLDYYERVVKTIVMTLVLLLLLQTRAQVEGLVWCLVLSLGYFSTKGGLHTLLTGGAWRVYGPPSSMVEENNALAVGTVIVMPLMYYLFHVSRRQTVRVALLGAMALSSVSVLGSWSRGGLLAVAAMLVLLWLRGRHKLLLSAAIAGFVLLALPFMPEAWWTRMGTISTYEQDRSASQRIVAWETAYNIAKARMPIGGGFEYQSALTSAQYSPDPTVTAVAHSIYFQLLGSQGVVGLLLFLAFWGLVWRQTTALRRLGASGQGLEWAHVLGSMIQASLLGYFVGGAFLNLAFWDLPYYLFAALVGALHVARLSRAAGLDAHAAAAPVAPASTALRVRTSGDDR